MLHTHPRQDRTRGTRCNPTRCAAAAARTRAAPTQSPVLRWPAAVVLALIFAVGCKLISPFDQNTYNAATALKEKSSVLILSATEPAATHAADIASLQRALASEVAYERGKGQPNAVSIKQWELFAKTVNDFIADWQKQLLPHKPAYLQDKVEQAGLMADEILRLESGKRR